MIANRRPRSQFHIRRLSLVKCARAFVLVTLLIILIGCGAAPGDIDSRAEQTGVGSLSPEAAAHNFLEDLDAALKDRSLDRDENRSYWVERLSGYFAPAERIEQQAALRAALTSFANGLRQLSPEQTLTLDLRFDGVEKLSESDGRALVRPINAQINLVIAHTIDRGPIVDYEQQIGLDKIIGRADGALPTVKIGERWFLTE